jgi:hypothetical protein
MVLGLDAGIRDHDVEMSKMTEYLLDGALHNLQISHVGADGEGIATQAPDVLHHSSDRLVPSTGHGNTCASGGEGLGDSPAYSLTTARDEGNLSFERGHEAP